MLSGLNERNEPENWNHSKNSLSDISKGYDVDDNEVNKDLKLVLGLRVFC